MYEVKDVANGVIFRRTNSPRMARLWVRIYNRLGFVAPNMTGWNTRLVFTYTLRGV